MSPALSPPRPAHGRPSPLLPPARGPPTRTSIAVSSSASTAAAQDRCLSFCPSPERPSLSLGRLVMQKRPHHCASSPHDAACAVQQTGVAALGVWSVKSKWPTPDL